jgi:hypothetical protein
MDARPSPLQPQHASQQLSPHFTLSELCTTTHSNIDNWAADPVIIGRLRALCVEVLETIRTYAKKTMVIHSGYRCPALNKAIGGSTTSQHMKGEAADFHVPGISNLELAQWIEQNVDFDQLILENFIVGQPNSGWIHCSYTSRTPLRNQSLTKFRGDKHYFPGLRIR